MDFANEMHVNKHQCMALRLNRSKNSAEGTDCSAHISSRLSCNLTTECPDTIQAFLAPPSALLGLCHHPYPHPSPSACSTPHPV
eukprot:746889-Hanusia_phi.AAC.8